MMDEGVLTSWRDELTELAAALAAAWEAVDSDAQLVAEAADPLSEAGVRERIAALFDRMAVAYLTATAEDRATIRGLFDGQDDLLDFLVASPESYISRIAAPTDVEPLRRGLALASISDRRPDPRELMLSVGRLCNAARSAGVDVASCLREAAELSSRESRHGSTTKDFFARLSTSASADR